MVRREQLGILLLANKVFSKTKYKNLVKPIASLLHSEFKITKKKLIATVLHFMHSTIIVSNLDTHNLIVMYKRWILFRKQVFL